MVCVCEPFFVSLQLIIKIYYMHLTKIELKEKYRCLEVGLGIELKPITLLVGDQGCGKSSLLSLLQKSSNKLIISLSENATENGVGSLYFDTEKMNPRTAEGHNYSNPDGTSKGIGMFGQLSSFFESHGETLKKFTVDRIMDAKDCVLLIDEPETALSLRNQYKLAEAINKVVDNNVQIILATHCLPLIESVGEVYSLEHLKWMSSKDFITLNKIN